MARDLWEESIKMNTKIRKSLVLAGFIMCLSVIGSFLASGSVLAQEDIRKGGEIAGDKSDSIPIQLKVGEMVQGEIAAVRNQHLRLSIADFNGKTIHYFGETSTRAGFYYAAKVNGQHYIVVTNPDGFSVGTRGYNITYRITPTDVAPGTGSGKNTSKDMTKPSTSMTTVWWILGAVVFIFIVLVALRGSRRDEEYEYIFFVIPIRRRR